MYPKGIYPCFHVSWPSKEQLFVELYFHIDFFFLTSLVLRSQLYSQTCTFFEYFIDTLLQMSLQYFKLALEKRLQSSWEGGLFSFNLPENIQRSFLSWKYVELFFTGFLFALRRSKSLSHLFSKSLFFSLVSLYQDSNLLILFQFWMSLLRESYNKNSIPFS